MNNPEPRIANRSDALDLLNELIHDGSRKGIPPYWLRIIKAIRDAIERDIL